MLSVKSDNPNYLARVVRLGVINKHPNADKLILTSVNGCTVISGLEAKEGALYIFFPIESALNRNYLSYSNSFSDAELNRDKTKKGFFQSKCRVRAIKLRGVVSEGYIVPVADIEDWLKSAPLKFKFTEDMVDTNFDYIGEIELLRKYVVPQKGMSSSGNKADKKIKRESKLVDNQFRLSLDLEHLKRNIDKINLEDYITISYKIHGTNAAMGKVLCKRPLNFIEKFLKKLGIKISDTHYDLVFSSRNVIKNQYADKKHDSYYDEDVWGLMATKYKDSIKEGITLYGEIAGQQSTGAAIQKDYDYGLPEKTCDFFVFRITFTNTVGHVFEFSTPQIQRYCSKMGLKIVPIFYYGTVENYLWENRRDLEFWDGEHYLGDWRDTWKDELLKVLIKNHTEKRCYMCKNNVPAEGVVLAVENEIVAPYKLKSLSFLERETKLLDSGEENIEDIS